MHHRHAVLLRAVLLPPRLHVLPSAVDLLVLLPELWGVLPNGAELSGGMGPGARVARGHGACLSLTSGRAPAGKLMMSPFGVRPSTGGVYTSWSESLRSQCPGTKTGLSVPGT